MMDVFITSIVSFVIEFGAKNPKVVPILAIAYLVGLVIKILRESVAKFVADSPSKTDDLKLAELEKSPIAKSVFFVADLLIRFKVK